MMKEPLKHLLQDDIVKRGESSIIDICEIIEGECSALGSEAKTEAERKSWERLETKFHKIMGTYLRLRD